MLYRNMRQADNHRTPDNETRKAGMQRLRKEADKITMVEKIGFWCHTQNTSVKHLYIQSSKSSKTPIISVCGQIISGEMNLWGYKPKCKNCIKRLTR